MGQRIERQREQGALFWGTLKSSEMTRLTNLTASVRVEQAATEFIVGVLSMQYFAMLLVQADIILFNAYACSIANHVLQYRRSMLSSPLKNATVRPATQLSFHKTLSPTSLEGPSTYFDSNLLSTSHPWMCTRQRR